MTLLDQFNKAVMEIIDEGGEALVLDYVVAIGLGSGVILTRETIDDAHAAISGNICDTIWFEMRRWFEPFQPAGYTRRATNQEWELLQVARDYDVESALNDTRGM